MRRQTRATANQIYAERGAMKATKCSLYELKIKNR